MLTISDAATQTECFVFDDVMELVETTMREEPRHPSTGSKIGWDSYTLKWTGHAALTTWGEVREQMAKPWEHGNRIVASMMEQIADAHITPPVSRQRKMRWNELQGDVCVDRAMAGDPLMLRHAHRELRHGNNTITLVCNLSENCGVNADDLLWKGCATIALCDLLEQAGYSCEVWGVEVSNGTFTRTRSGYSTGMIATKLKDSGDPVDVQALTCAISSWFFRRVIIGALFVNQENSVAGGCGMAADASTEQLALLGIDDSDTTHIVKRCQTRQDAMKQITAIMERVTSHSQGA